jgi:hypothetical protein
VAYICRHYIHRFLHRLTEEYNIYSSVKKVYLSVITDERFCASYSDAPINDRGRMRNEYLNNKIWQNDVTYANMLRLNKAPFF